MSGAELSGGEAIQIRIAVCEILDCPPYFGAGSSPVARASLVVPPILIGMPPGGLPIVFSTQVPTNHRLPRIGSHDSLSTSFSNVECITRAKPAYLNGRIIWLVKISPLGIATWRRVMLR